MAQNDSWLVVYGSVKDAMKIDAKITKKTTEEHAKSQQEA